MSPFAAQRLFGDQGAAGNDLIPMAVAEKLPEESKEQRLARFIARGGLERSRGARIVEGAASGTPLSRSELGMENPPAGEEPAGPTAPMRLSRKPADKPPAARTPVSGTESVSEGST